MYLYHTRCSALRGWRPGLLSALLSSLLISGCSTSTLNQTEPPRGGTYYGPAAQVGAGEAQAFVELNASGAPERLGVRLSEAALSQLPSSGVWEYLLRLPAQAQGSGYDHVTLDWNPHGHVPPGVYDVPHFDLHFYLISAAERDGISVTGADLARAHRPPPSEHMPLGYVLPPGTEVPKMGAHAIDPAADEFNGAPFTKTFIYGFYDGQMVFLEPMFTLAYLQSKPAVAVPVAQPQAYGRQGYYPRDYGIRYLPAQQQFEITLEGLTRH